MKYLGKSQCTITCIIMLIATIFISLFISNSSFFVSSHIAALPSMEGFESGPSGPTRASMDSLNEIMIDSKLSDLMKIEKIKTNSTDSKIKEIVDEKLSDASKKLMNIQTYITSCNYGSETKSDSKSDSKPDSKTDSKTDSKSDSK